MISFDKENTSWEFLALILNGWYWWLTVSSALAGKEDISKPKALQRCENEVTHAFWNQLENSYEK